MYPNPLFKDIDLYTVFMCIGLVSAIVLLSVFSDKKKIYWKLQNLCLVTAGISVVFGYFSAVLFQALYNIEERGKFIIDRYTGATFYGGLIGGAACFLAIYFIAGHFIFKKNKEHIKDFFKISDIAAAAICSAHAFGRIGCLMAGCCHGGVTDKWYGIYMPAIGEKVVPVQLYEAVFLFILLGFFLYRLIKNKSCNLPIYMGIYGLWRFLIEFLRKDDRGTTFVKFLSPSQLIAVLMIIGAVVLYFAEKAMMKKQADTEISEEINE